MALHATDTLTAAPTSEVEAISLSASAETFEFPEAEQDPQTV